MSILGLYTQKEVEEIIKEQKDLGYSQGSRETRVEIQREMNKKIEEIIKSDGNIITDLLSDVTELEIKLEKKVAEIAELRKFSVPETDKKIKRLEIIKKRTRKQRVKKKCENEILRYIERKMIIG